IHVAKATPGVEDIMAVESRLDQRRGLDWAAHMAFVDPTRGHIIGVVDLIDVHHATDEACCSAVTGKPCSVWAEDGANHLVLANPRALDEPIQFRGALGLRTLPDDVAAAVL